MQIEGKQLRCSIFHDQRNLQGISNLYQVELQPHLKIEEDHNINREYQFQLQLGPLLEVALATPLLPKEPS